MFGVVNHQQIISSKVFMPYNIFHHKKLRVETYYSNYIAPQPGKSQS